MPIGSRDPPTQCRQIFDAIDKGTGKASKWDLVKLVGSEAAFRRWITDLLIQHRFLEQFSEDRTIFFKKTEKGKIFHQTLKDWHIIVAYKRLSGKRLRSEVQVDR